MFWAATLHFAANGAKLAFERDVLRHFYPSAFSRPVASVAAFASYGLALAATEDWKSLLDVGGELASAL